MTQKKPIPQEIRNFIDYLKEQDLYIYLDKQGESLYLLHEDKKITLNFLYRLYLKHCPHNAFEDWGNYVKASIPHIIGKLFHPAKDRLIPTSLPDTYQLNKYRKYEAKSDNSQPDLLWFEYLERLFPAEEERQLVVNWLAHMFQMPEERPSWHLLLSSEQGTGKGFLFNDILSPLLSRQTELCPDYHSFMKQFSTSLNGTLLCLLDDPKSKSEHTQTKLKSKLTEEFQTVEEKYEQPQTQQIFTRVILASNEYRPLKLDDGERRWYVPQRLVHRVDGEETQEFITRLSDYLKAGGLDVIYNWFMTQDLSGFNHKYCPTTGTLSSMIEASRTTLEGDLEEWIKDNPVFRWEELKEKFDGKPDDLLKKHLTELSYRKSKITIDKGTRQWLWFPADMPTSTAKRLRYVHPTDYPLSSPF